MSYNWLWQSTIDVIDDDDKCFPPCVQFVVYHILHAKVSFNKWTECHTGTIAHHLETECPHMYCCVIISIFEFPFQGLEWKKEMRKKQDGCNIPSSWTPLSMLLLMLTLMVFHNEWMLNCETNIIIPWSVAPAHPARGVLQWTRYDYTQTTILK